MSSNGGGFFDRLANLWNGFWSLWIGGQENKNPRIVYESAINARIQKHGQLKKAASNIIYLRNKLAKEFEASTAELTQINAQIPIAIDEGEDEVALHLIERKNELAARIESIQKELEQTKEEAEEAKRSLVAFQSEIEKLRTEKERMLAAKEHAEARIKIQETLSGLSMDADIKALDNVREHIGKLQAEADMGAELGNASLDGRLRKIREKAVNVQAQAQLAEFKKQRAAQKSAAAQQQFAKAI